jgi:lysophospholipase L1-like esterase
LRFVLIAAAVLLAGAAPAGVRVEPATKAGAPLPMHVAGRTAEGLRQWPGTYFETAFRGSSALFRVGPGEVSLRIRVDGGAPVALVKPAPGLYRVAGLGTGAHRLRIDVASESQAGPTAFGGFYALPGTRPLPVPRRARQIEFIGDSHTVGYGNTSSKRECSEDEVWATTDTSRGIAPLTAARYDADYQVNAISGRGIVRNYGGFAADTLPEAYPYALLDHKTPYRDRAWRPRVIVVALGTNDFTTPLHAGEKWPSRGALYADFEATYAAFLARLRAANPEAHFILWATDMADGEIAAEVRKVVDRVRASGERRIGFVPVRGLALTGCNYHPNLADDRATADAIAAYIDSHAEIRRVLPQPRSRD